MTIKDQIAEFLGYYNDPKEGIRNPDRKSNVGLALFDCFVWQEISNNAEEQLKQAWGTLAREGLVKTDDQMRMLDPGEHLVVESDHFSCLAKVSAPRLNLDKEAFYAALARKFKTSKESIEDLAASCSKPTKPPLSKRVLEV